MESPSIAQEFCSLKEKARLVGSLVRSLHSQAPAQGAEPSPEHNAAALPLLWAELEQSINEVANEFDYLRDLGKHYHIPELLFALNKS